MLYPAELRAHGLIPSADLITDCQPFAFFVDTCIFPRMLNRETNKSATLYMIFVLTILGLGLLWFFSSQMVPLSQGIRPALPQKLLSPSGEYLDLSSFKGKPLLVNFWATWCPPCLDELPGFVNASKKFSERVSFIGMAVDSAAPEIKRFQETLKIPYPIAMATWEMVSAWKAEQLPVTYLLNEEGEIIWSHRGAVSEPDLMEAINHLLGR